MLTSICHVQLDILSLRLASNSIVPLANLQRRTATGQGQRKSGTPLSGQGKGTRVSSRSRREESSAIGSTSTVDCWWWRTPLKQPPSSRLCDSSQFSSHLLSLSVGVNKTTVGLVVTSTGLSQSTRFGCHVLRNMGVVSQKSKGRPRAADAPEQKDQMGAVRGLRLARARHKSRNDAGPMRWRVFSADVTRAKKRKGCAAQKSSDV